MTARASADGAGISFIALGGYPSRCDSVNKRFVVAFVLAGVGSGELGDSLVEHVRAAEIGGNGDPDTHTSTRMLAVGNLISVRGR